MESGTGSGSLSRALLRCIAPQGHLYTYEYHAQRAEEGRKDFTGEGEIGRHVTVYNRDSVEEGFQPLVRTMKLVRSKEKKSDGDSVGNINKEEKKSEDTEMVDSNSEKKEEEVPGDEDDYEYVDEKVDAVMLDLPNPYMAIRHAAKVMKAGGRLCNYSPCIEQVQRTCLQLQEYNFEELKTVEVTRRPYDVKCAEEEELEVLKPLYIREKTREGGKDDEEEEEEEGSEKVGAGKRKKGYKSKRHANEVKKPRLQLESVKTSSKWLTEPLQTKPYGDIRGHTAYLTFATFYDASDASSSSSSSSSSSIALAPSIVPPPSTQ